MAYSAAFISEEEEGENDCSCTREYSPICASNGITYANACSFNCAKATIPDLEPLYDAECEEEIVEYIVLP